MESLWPLKICREICVDVSRGKEICPRCWKLYKKNSMAKKRFDLRRKLLQFFFNFHQKHFLIIINQLKKRALAWLYFVTTYNTYRTQMFLEFWILPLNKLVVTIPVTNQKSCDNQHKTRSEQN